MKKLNRSSWSLNSKLNHPERISPREDNPPTISPIYQAVKFVVSPKASYGDQFIYTRMSNPTLRQLEVLLAQIQRREDCIVFSSGIAAITHTMLGLLKSGDHVITFRELYKPARSFIRDMLPRFGISSSILKLSDKEQVEKAIIPGKTRLIHFESPTNPNLEIADIEFIIQAARKHNVLVSMDGTFAGLHQHTEFDLDLMIHSLTKYANGHGDVMAGSVAGKSQIIQQIKPMAIALGATLDPHAAFLVERGLKTYYLRFERQCQNALKVAQYLDSHPKISKVYYPGLKSHRRQSLAQQQMKDMGAMVSFEISSQIGNADEFAHRLSMIQFAVSLGSTETLIAPTYLFFGDDLSEADKEEMGINRRTLRLSVGVEDIQDILADLASALG